MKIKIYGFGFSKEKAPKSIHPDRIFQRMAQTPTLQENSDVRYWVGSINVPHHQTQAKLEWHIGVLLRVRDSKLLTKLTEENGQQKFAAELLNGAERIADANVFLVNPKTGAGLYTHYHQSTAMTGHFFRLLGNHFRAVQKEMKESVEAQNFPPAIKKAELAGLKNFLIPHQRVLSEDFPELVAGLKNVNAVTLRIAGVVASSSVFQGFKVGVKEEKIIVKMVDTEPADLAEALSFKLESDEISNVTVDGKDKFGKDRHYKMKNNPDVVAEADFDEKMNDFSLDMANPEKSFPHSKLVQWLVDLASKKANIWNLLTQP